MRDYAVLIAFAATTLALVGAAASDEEAIQLKPGPGVELVEANCSACHSLDYIQMNSTFLDEKGWTAVVTKMVKAFGAPVDEADQQQIIAYLVASYGKPTG